MFRQRRKAEKLKAELMVIEAFVERAKISAQRYECEGESSISLLQVAINDELKELEQATKDEGNHNVETA